MKFLYEIEFVDGEKLEGGTIESPNWLNIPDKSIKKLIYRLPDGKKVECEDYNAYYHFVEVCQDIMNGEKGKVRLEYAYLIAKEGSFCEVLKINLRTKKVMQDIMDEDNEWIKKLNPIGWKKGI